MAVDQAELKEIIRAVLAETAEERAAREEALLKRAFDNFLIAIGIDPYATAEQISKDLKDLRATLTHSDQWRKSVNQVRKVTTATAVTVIVTGFLGAAWLGITDKIKLPWGH